MTFERRSIVAAREKTCGALKVTAKSAYGTSVAKFRADSDAVVTP